MSESNCKHPEIVVKLTGRNGNVFNLIGEVRRAMRRAKLPESEVDQFSSEVTSSSSYDEALGCIVRWVGVK